MTGRLSATMGLRGRLWMLVVASSLGAAACEPSAATTAARSAVQVAPTGARWRAARRELSRLRHAYSPRQPYTMNVSLQMTHPVTGRRLRARGAVAVSPADDALRMILLGPGGTTALDLWICGETFRFSLPAVGLKRRGDQHTKREELRGLPVDFLRWWLLSPLDGSLLHVGDEGASRRFVLRDGDEIVDLTVAAGEPLAIERRSVWDRHRVVADGPGCADVRYHQRSTGIDVEIRCESLDRRRPPQSKAFADPDAPDQTGCHRSGAST